jgi:hypothetical protein
MRIVPRITGLSDMEIRIQPQLYLPIQDNYKLNGIGSILLLAIILHLKTSPMYLPSLLLLLPYLSLLLLIYLPPPLRFFLLYLPILITLLHSLCHPFLTLFLPLPLRPAIHILSQSNRPPQALSYSKPIWYPWLHLQHLAQYLPIINRLRVHKCPRPTLNLSLNKLLKTLKCSTTWIK